MLRAPDLTTVLSAGPGRPTRKPFAALVPALPVAAWTKFGASGLTLVGPRSCWRVGGTRDIPVEALFPEGRERFELGSSGWPRVLGIDAVGGPPHCDFANEGGARVASRRCPDWRAVTLADLILNLVGEVGDELGSLCQVDPPDGMVMERLRNPGKPGQRAWVGRRELWEPPVENGGDVACGREIATAGGFL